VRWQVDVRGWPRWRTVIAIAAVALALAAAGCGSSSKSSSTGGAAVSTSTSSSVHLAKTKFVLHAGLAFGTFHRWIYKPVKAGALKHPLSHKLALVKGGLAAAFVIHEVKLALAAAKGDPTLSKLVAPLTALQSKLSSLPSALRSGKANGSDVVSANDSIASLKQQAAGAGQPVSETSQSF
jgi:hypothetical protein